MQEAPTRQTIEVIINKRKTQTVMIDDKDKGLAPTNGRDQGTEK